MKIAIAQINTLAGDFEYNSKKILDSLEKFKNQNVDLVVFPELSLCGYSPKDFVEYKSFLKICAKNLNSLAKKVELPCIVGCARASKKSRGAYNSAFLLKDKKAMLIADKQLLPNYASFNEARNFDSGSTKKQIAVKDKKIAVTICEDIWTADFVETAGLYKGKKPLDFVKGADVVINISASLWNKENEILRKKLLSHCAKECNSTFVFCNLVGGNDEAVFDGASCVLNSAGESILSLKKFEEDFDFIDLENQKKAKTKEPDFIADLYSALVMSLRDFVQKNGFQKVLLGISGGIDSALVAALAVDALGKENVLGISLPSKISSEHSKQDACDLAKNLGIDFFTVPIENLVDATENSLSEIFAGAPKNIAEENIQARSRGLILMAVSNKQNRMLLTTGNKSECAVGYCTLYGDMCGSFNPICDVYKTDVYKLANYINREKEIIPISTIKKAPSAELREGQKDSDSLPEYEILDEILKLHIEESLGEKEIIEKGFDKKIVKDTLSKVLRNEFKRRQSAIGPCVSKKNLCTSRKVPLVFKG